MLYSAPTFASRVGSFVTKTYECITFETLCSLKAMEAMKRQEEERRVHGGNGGHEGHEGDLEETLQGHEDIFVCQ